jgi:hypothetical protein
VEASGRWRRRGRERDGERERTAPCVDAVRYETVVRKTKIRVGVLCEEPFLCCRSVAVVSKSVEARQNTSTFLRYGETLNLEDSHLNGCSVGDDASADFDAFGGLTFRVDVVYGELSFGAGDAQRDEEGGDDGREEACHDVRWSGVRGIC